MVAQESGVALNKQMGQNLSKYFLWVEVQSNLKKEIPK